MRLSKTFTKEEYAYDAWGEHADNDNLPTVANNIRYIGARLECFVHAVNSTDAIYEMGVRHYWPGYGRFLQRDPMGYNKIPSPSTPLAANPYIYAENNPVMKSDPSGMFVGNYYRSAVMGGFWLRLGTLPTPEGYKYLCGGGYGDTYDCCTGYNTIPDDQIDDAMLWHSQVGFKTLGWWKSYSHQESAGLCDLDPTQAQPNEGCPNAVLMMPPDLACTYLSRCKGASCQGSSTFPPFFNLPISCPHGETHNDVGYSSDPRNPYFPTTILYTLYSPNNSAFFYINGTSLIDSLLNKIGLPGWEYWEFPKLTYPWDKPTSGMDPFEEACVKNRPNWVRQFEIWGSVAVIVGSFNLVGMAILDILSSSIVIALTIGIVGFAGVVGLWLSNQAIALYLSLIATAESIYACLLTTFGPYWARMQPYLQRIIESPISNIIQLPEWPPKDDKDKSYTQ